MSIFFSFNLFTVKLRGIEAFVTSMEAVTEKKQGYVWKSQPRSLGLVSVRRFELFRCRPRLALAALEVRFVLRKRGSSTRC